jgi:purine-binding chemotaxis protein CheW
LPIDHVVETMRPLTVETVAATPAFVRGVSVVRGAPVPVVDLGAILGCTGAASPTRFVTLSVQGRTVALAVEGIVGVRFVPRAAAEALPPLLRDASKDVVETIGRLDSALLVVLRAGRIVPEEVWKDLMGTEAPA